MSSFASKALTTILLIVCERPRESVKNISSTLLTKTDTILGKGCFATCIKGYSQGTSVCIKMNNDDACRADLMHEEADSLFQFGHPAVCFLQGTQTHAAKAILYT